MTRLVFYYSIDSGKIVFILIKPQGAVQVGVDYGEDPPVPIPNTEVKLISADDTWLETAWENRYSPTQFRACDTGSSIPQ